MKNIEEEFCAKVSGDKLIIEIPLDILEQSQKLRDDIAYDIIDKKEMAKYFADTIIWHTQDVGDQEVGASMLTHLIDDIFDYAYEGGETWLENP